MAESAVNAFDIKAALELRWRRTGRAGFWPEITVPAPDGDLRLDGVALEWQYGNMWVHGYEIKVSRSDWLRDAKYERYRRYCDTLTVVCPKGMIGRDEMPGDIGLMWYEPDTAALRYRRKPGYDAPGKDTGILKDRLLREIVRSVWYDPSVSRYGRYATAREYLDQKTEMKGVGRALGSKMALRLQNLEERCEPTHRRRTEAKAAAYDRLVGLLYDSGWRQIEPWADPEHIDTALARLGEALRDTVPAGLLDETLEEAIGRLEELRDRHGVEGGGRG
ncbi:MmcB family DNA repair protein [Bifidobacterium myosotis]|uniref:DNA repair protein MmcB-related protein n=1 Tax=Bifidobacterium myosotis TaxID=1630166 RepID=A0A5M9ZKL2_9BIFI|nr:MmcB family DNA repair protein [Bifidobacterium myosotis]KAA8828131.1 DNA repair protein MmcB-related protein [Bifidobacterium myosotis]